MIPLPDTYKKYGYTFHLLERRGDVAIFSQCDEGKIIAYEVFEVEKQQETTITIGGRSVTYEAKEKVPSTERWGVTAYTCRTVEAAYEKLQHLEERIASRKEIVI